MSKNEDKPGIAWNLMIIALTIAAAPFWSWVAVKLWTWFLIPLGAPAIGMAHAYGISSLVALFTSGIIAGIARIKTVDETEKERDVNRVVMAWMAPLLCLGFGYVAHALM